MVEPGGGQGVSMSGIDSATAAGVLACGAAAAAAAGFVWSRRKGGAGTSLAAMLAALAVWNLAYGAELMATAPDWRITLGDLKYVGIVGLTPGWLTFILFWTGRGHRVTRGLLALLAVEPVLVLVLLAVPATHDLVRHLPVGPGDPLLVEVAVGPAFWAHLVYTDLLLLPATGLFIASLLQRSRAYWLQALALMVAAVLPWVANLLFICSVGPFGRVDLTPVVFTVTGLVLAWGLFEQRLLRLEPLARQLVVEQMTDAVLVLDAFGHLSDVNPAGLAVLGGERGRLLGRRAADLLPAQVLASGGAEVLLGERAYEVTDVPLPGRHRAPAGRLIVLRDVTERSRLDRRLRELLAQQARVADQLSLSLRPAALPEVPGLRLAARFRPTGDGREIGGDFYEVFPVGEQWAFTLGDVSGKGARAAAIAAHARYTLRTLVLAGAQPAHALQQLHALLASVLDEETYLTVAHGRLRVTPEGATVGLALGGHPQPLAVRAQGGVEAVGVPGSAIGLFDTVDITEAQVRLGPGDALCVFTDGVSEARTGAALFGEGALMSTLARCAGSSAEALAETLLDEVLGLHVTLPIDDIALLVLQPVVGAAGPFAAPRPRQSSQTDDDAGTRTTPSMSPAPSAVDSSSFPAGTASSTSSPSVFSTTTSPPSRTSASTPAGAASQLTSRPSPGSSDRRSASSPR